MQIRKIWRNSHWNVVCKESVLPFSPVRKSTIAVKSLSEAWAPTVGDGGSNVSIVSTKTKHAKSVPKTLEATTRYVVSEYSSI